VSDARLIKLEMELLELKDMVRQALAILEANDRWNPQWLRQMNAKGKPDDADRDD
jgi:hypothetical protein